jgi:hypothetical protein
VFLFVVTELREPMGDFVKTGEFYLVRMSSNCFIAEEKEFEDDPRSGRLLTVRNPGTVSKVRELVARHRRMTLKLMEDRLHVSGSQFTSFFVIFERG